MAPRTRGEYIALGMAIGFMAIGVILVCVLIVLACRKAVLRKQQRRQAQSMQSATQSIPDSAGMTAAPAVQNDNLGVQPVTNDGADYYAGTLYASQTPAHAGDDVETRINANRELIRRKIASVIAGVKAASTPQTTPAPAESDRLCSICMDKEANVVWIDCGHVVSCLDCAALLRAKGEEDILACPLCRTFGFYRQIFFV